MIAALLEYLQHVAKLRNLAKVHRACGFLRFSAPRWNERQRNRVWWLLIRVRLADRADFAG